jgi:hypothetical protein
METRRFDWNSYMFADAQAATEGRLTGCRFLTLADRGALAKSQRGLGSITKNVAPSSEGCVCMTAKPLISRGVIWLAAVLQTRS